MITIAKASASRRSRAQARTSRRNEAPADEPGTPSVVAGGVRLGDSSICIHKLYLYHARASRATVNSAEFVRRAANLESTTVSAASYDAIAMAPRVALILPALDEEQNVAAMLDELARATQLDGLPGLALAQIIVVDNGSTDRTAAVARERGAQVVLEPRRGYGQACLAGIAAVGPQADIIAFMDADGSDDPAELSRLIAPIERGEADLVLGSRVLGQRETGSLTPQQQFGNLLATFLMRVFYGARFTDLGPFRAIRRDALDRIGMRDTNFGWTTEMQIKAAQHRLRILEIPARHRRRRGGKSKIAGSIRGSLLAAAKIIWTILRYRFSS